MIRLWPLAVAFGLLAWAADAQESRPAPEAATAVASKALVVAAHHMVVAADPRAAEAGREILRAGGSAVDAAIATQMVLGLVEPQSSGLGGGAFLVYWDAAARGINTYDGRETAPASAKPDRFLRDGQPMSFDEAVRSGLSVGVPGVVRMLELTHQKHGKLPWAALFTPAIRLAENGFAVSPRLSELLAMSSPGRFAEGAKGYFYDASGQPRPAGFLLKNPDYAATLKAIAEKGSAAFYEGPIAEAILAAVQGAPIAQGDLTAADLKRYVPKEREPVCFTYRAHRICGMGPPSSGGVTVAQTLKLIEPFTQVQGPGATMSGAALHIIADAEKLSFADRNRYLGDP